MEQQTNFPSVGILLLNWTGQRFAAPVPMFWKREVVAGHHHFNRVRFQYACLENHEFPYKFSKTSYRLHSKQLALSALDIWGTFVNFLAPSRAAISNGLTRDKIIGTRPWDFADGHQEASRMEDAFSRCLIHREIQVYYTRSEIGGNVEHWECTMLPAHGAEVVCLGREVTPATSIELTPEEQSLLKLLCDDQTLEEIGFVMSLPPSTVASRVRRLRERAGCKTNHGLVAFCLRFGIV